MEMVVDARELGARAPNFFLAGAPKAGTTSLYRYLDQHPQIYMSPIKEPSYFAEEMRFGNFTEEWKKMAAARNEALREYLDGPVKEKFSGGPVEEWTDYGKLFQQVKGESAIGEASVCYLWSKTAARNIASVFPDAKILVVLRNPIERAFSQYRHMLSFAGSHVTFGEHIDASLRSKSTRIGELNPFLEFGFYYQQLRRYFDLFPRERIGISFHADYLQSPQAMLHDTFGFLGVDPSFAPDFSERHMRAAIPRWYTINRMLKRSGAWRLMRDFSPLRLRRKLRSVVFEPRHSIRPEASDCARLAEYYRDDVMNLSSLLSRDLSGWLKV
jgi:hypothetical protein